MSILAGKDGNIKWDASVARQDIDHIQSWSIDVIQETNAEITSMQDADGWRNFIGGFNDWTATVEALLDTTGLSIDLAVGNPNGLGDIPCTLELWMVYEASNYKGIYGNCICTSISPGVNKDGIATVTYEFQGSAIVTYWSNAFLPGI